MTKPKSKPALLTAKALVVSKPILYVMVQFAGSGGSYLYMTDRDDIEPGDRVVVDSPNAGFQVVEVIATDNTYRSEATKYVVDKVDTRDYFNRIEMARKRDEIKKELRTRMKTLDEDRQMKLYAKEDPEFAGLLEQLDALK